MTIASARRRLSSCIRGLIVVSVSYCYHHTGTENPQSVRRPLSGDRSAESYSRVLCASVLSIDSYVLCTLLFGLWSLAFSPRSGSQKVARRETSGSFILEIRA